MAYTAGKSHAIQSGKFTGVSLILECRASEKVFFPVDSFRFALERVGVVGGLVSVTDPRWKYALYRLLTFGKILKI